jgi:hypothetical protein
MVLLDSFVTSGITTEVIKTEQYDRRVMAQLWADDGLGDDEKKLVQKLYNKGRTGKVTTNYNMYKGYGEKNIGRYMAKGGSLQTLPGHIRSSLAAKYYWDLDVANCHPVILLQLGLEQGWDVKLLEDYVENRDARLAEVGETLNTDDRDNQKMVFISMLYGSTSYFKKSDYLTNFTNEMTALKNNIIQLVPELLESVKKCKTLTQQVPGNRDWKESTVAIFLQTIERTILLTIQEFLNSKSRHLDVYIHDGGLVRKVPYETEFPPILLTECSEFIKTKTGFDLKLTIKPLVNMYQEMAEESALDNAFKEFEKNHFYLRADGLVCEEEDGTIVGRWKSKLAQEALGNTYKVSDAEGKSVPIITTWTASPKRRTYDRIGFYPGDMTANVYNLYRGPGVASAEPGSDGVPAFKALLSVLLKGDEPAMKFLTQWIAHMFQKPAERVGTSVIFTGSMGIGKDMLWNFIGEELLGKKLFFNSTDHERDILGSFNGLLEGRLLIKMEEVSGQFMREKNERVKGFITAKNLTINIKCVSTYDVEKYDRLVMTTNDPVPVVVNTTDRRFNIFHCGESKRGDTAWYKATWDAMVTGRRSIYDWLQSIDLTDFNPNAIFRTEYHSMLAEGEKPTQERFIDECAEDPMYDKKDRTATDLWNDYKTFCGRNGFQCCHVNHFIRKLGHYIGNGRMVKRLLHGKPLYTITVAGANTTEENYIINST